MGQALYRKYRSKTLAEMVGQEHITTALAGSIKSGRIGHAYLFTGPRGTGKTSAARILAHEINSLPYDDSQHLDIIEIDAASNRRIDDIRDLRGKVHIAPTSSKYKVYIIDEVHMLTGESFNALLKTLEEPPEHVVFILATTEVHKLPATIISRTQRYSFRSVEPEKVIAHLRYIAQKEKLTVDDEALELIAEHGEGSFRDSINLLDQLANVNNGNIDAAAVEQSLGLASKQAVSGLIEAAAQKNHQALLKQLQELEKQGTTTAALLPQLIRQLQAIATERPEFFALIDDLLEIPRTYNPRLKLLTALVQFALNAQAPTTTESPEKAAIPPRQHQPTPVATPKPILHVEKPQPTKRAQKKEAENEPLAEGKKLSDITEQQWSQLIHALKAESAPLHGVFKQAQPVFDAASNTLTLKFKYALHRRKADDNKAKKILAGIMLTQLGGAPILRTELDTDAITPVIKEAEPIKPVPKVDEVASAVINLMGGGEVVNA